MPWCSYCGSKLHDNTSYCTVCHRLLEKSEKSPLPLWLTGEKLRRQIETWAETGSTSSPTESGSSTAAATGAAPTLRSPEAVETEAQPGSLFAELRKAFEEQQASAPAADRAGTAETAIPAGSESSAGPQPTGQSPSRGLVKTLLLILFAVFVIVWQIVAPEQGEGAGGTIYFIILIAFWILSSLFSKRSGETAGAGPDEAAELGEGASATGREEDEIPTW